VTASGLHIGVINEQAAGESRVAASPETVKKFIGLGASVSIETAAGHAAGWADTAYTEAGATVISERAALLGQSDVLLSVRGLPAGDAAAAKKGCFHTGLLDPFRDRERLKALESAGLTALALEFIPRITRAQSMDVLSSQANLAGYKAVLDACEHYGRALPMMMTAAGTVPAAKVMIMGAGVAGLQAIATAKRLGAIVSATDVRLAAKEQVESLGGKFVMVEDEEAMAAAETSGGYATEMSDAYKAKQAELISATIAKMDIVITTALIPGRPAPELISAEQVKTMKPGSVIVDLAVENGGNCALSKAGEIVEAEGVTIIGHQNVPGRLASDASALFARNAFNLLSPFISDGQFNPDFEDQILVESVVTRDGKIVHPRLTEETAS